MLNIFDKQNRKCKRNFQLNEQSRLEAKLLNNDNPKEFWKKIGEIGMANDRKLKIPLEVYDENGHITNDRSEVFDKWKADYENVFNSNIDTYISKKE